MERILNYFVILRTKLLLQIGHSSMRKAADGTFRGAPSLVHCWENACNHCPRLRIFGLTGVIIIRLPLSISTELFSSNSLLFTPCMIIVCLLLRRYFGQNQYTFLGYRRRATH